MFSHKTNLFRTVVLDACFYFTTVKLRILDIIRTAVLFCKTGRYTIK